MLCWALDTVQQKIALGRIFHGGARLTQLVKDVKRIAVVGAGQMGRGIAQVAAQSGFEVVLFDVSQQALDGGLDFIQRQLQRGVEKGKWQREHAQQSLARLECHLQWERLGHCHFAIEAASENKEIKFDLFRQLDATLPPGAVLASNTSSISITEIGAVTKRPSRVVGMHFMNPVPGDGPGGGDTGACDFGCSF